MGLTMAIAAYLSALVTYFFPGVPGTATVTFVGAIAGIVIVYLATQTNPTAAGAATSGFFFNPSTIRLLLAVVVGFVAFTAVEVVGLFYWLQFGNTQQGITILVETLLLEHGISVIVGVLAGMLVSRLFH